MRRIVLLALLTILPGCRKVLSPDEALRLGEPVALRRIGFAGPEAVLHDPISDVYYVSNVNGSPLAADDNGFISVVSPEGSLLQLKWIDGGTDSVTLHAPKGMAVDGALLYVADLNVVRKFDRQTGAPRGAITIPGASSLVGLVVGNDGSLYLTDAGLRAGPGADSAETSGSAAVYRIQPSGKLDTLARGEGLGQPWGIAVSGDSVWVVGFASGELARLKQGASAAAVKLPAGGLAGLLLFNGEAFVTSWDGQAVYRGPPGGPFTQVLDKLQTPAGLGHDLWRHRLLIPLFRRDEIWIVPLAGF